MAGRLGKEIKQKKPFQSIEEEAYLNIVRTADTLIRNEERLLKLSELTFSQYNLLRILKGAGDEGLPCIELAERMITYSPDLTRLLDRLEARQLVSRARDEKDRRVVRTRITFGGTELLRRLEKPVKDVHRHQLGVINRERILDLIRMMEEIRIHLE